MQLIKDNFFVTADPDVNKTLKIKGLDGKYLYIDTDFNPYSYATRTGVIAHVPYFIDKDWDYDIPLKAGDVVLLHHFVCQDKMMVHIGDDTYFKAPYYHIFAKVEDETVIPLEDFLFVNPIEEDESDMFMGKIQIKFEKGFKEGVAIINYLSPKCEKAGLKKGDKVYYTADADYKVHVLGTMFYRMRLRNILLVDRDGELICLNERVLLKKLPFLDSFGNDNRQESLGQIVKVNKNISNIQVEDTVGYFNGLIKAIEYEGDELLLVKENDINYIK